jgi:hypothetical protein
MSLEMNTYVPIINNLLIPQWISEIQKLGMDCEMHPNISLISHNGFLPFKIRIRDSIHKELNGVDFLTGFEFYSEDFNLQVELDKRTPKSGGLGRFLRGKSRQEPYATVELDKKLECCRKLLTFSWGAADLFELRMVNISSAVLAEITGGVVSYPADNIWYNRSVVESLAEAREYENSCKPRDIKVHRFERWL